MKSKNFSFLSFSLVVILSLLLPNSAIAGKKKNQPAQTTISAVTNDGSNRMYASVLDPTKDDINVLLQSLLYILKKGDLSKLSFVLNSARNSTQSYTIPPNAISIQRKKINKKYNKFVVVSLYNLTTPAGISVSPSSLPKDNYKLRIQGNDIDIASDPIDYQTPVLIAGISKSPGVVKIEDENGNEISEHTVATNLNGTFFTEVRADKIKSQNESRRFLKSQEENPNGTSTQEENIEVDTGYVHVITDKDLYAVVPLDNDAKNNDIKAEKPLQVDEGSTFTAQLAKNNKDLANEAAKEELATIESGEETPVSSEPDEIDCNIDKFADRCTSTTDDSIYTSIGSDFRGFLQSNTCNFHEFDLIKKVILASPENTNIYTGKGYCEYFKREVNDNKPCEAYSQILADYKSGLTKQLSCPPDSCDQFSYIKLPKCFTTGGFCNENPSNNNLFTPTAVCRGSNCSKQNTNTCIHKQPPKNLYCAKVGTDIDASECVDDPSSGLPQIGWTIATNSLGNQYCVAPANQSYYSKNLTLQEIADQCELNSCHNNCSKQSGALSEELNNCHLTCEANAGRYFDCSKPQSKFFSTKCCFNVTGVQGGQGQSNNGDFVSQKAPIPLDIRNCLCENSSNFNEKGFVKEEAQAACKNSCSQGYELSPDGQNCFPICDQGLVRDQNGFCKKKCPPGSLQDNFGNCSCPFGQTFGKSGKCENSSCPDYCKNYPLVRKFLAGQVVSGSGYIPPSTGPGYIPPTVGPGYGPPSTTGSYTPGYLPGYSPSPSSSLPLECQRCLGGGGGPGSCGPNSKYDPVTHQCVPTAQCGPNQYADSTGACRCSDGTLATSVGPEGCKNQNNNCGNSNMFPNPNYTPGGNQAQCICPPGLPFWDSNSNNNGGQCVAVCSDGKKPYENQTGLPINSPIPCYSGGQTSCPQATPIKCSDGTCKLTQADCTNSCPAATPYKCGDGTCATTATACPYTCPSSYPVKCSDGTCKLTQADCIGTNICPLPYIKDPAFSNQCACPAATPYESGTTCVAACPSNLIPTTIPGGPYNSTRQVCKCSDGSYPTGNGTCNSTCPAATPYKCGDGTCAISATACPYTCPSSYPVKCSDGTCKLTQADCTNSCPAATPYKCGDGTCATTATACPYTCPSSTPYKCPNGICATSSATCGSTSCPAPYITNPAYNSSNPAGVPPCICSNGKYYYNNDCVATCPNSLVTGTPSSGCGAGSIPSCLCSGTLQCPGLNGQCASITFTSAEISGTNLVTKFTSSNLGGGCPYLYNSAGTNIYSLCGADGTRTENIPLSAFATNNTVKSGDVLKLCQSNSLANCSNTVTVSSPQTVTLNSIKITGNNATISYTKNFPECALLVNSSSNTILHNGVNAYSLLCSATGETTTASAASFLNISPGTQVKLCKSTANNTNFDPNVCSPLATVTTNDTISLNSVVRNTSGDLTVTYNKSFADCVGLRQNDINGLRVTGQNQFCSTSDTQTVTASTLKSTVQVGTQVALCNDVTGFCSLPISITSPPRITLNSVVFKSNDGTISLNFTKDTGDCVRLKNADNVVLDIPNHCFGGATGVVYPVSALNAIPTTGTQVKICYLSEDTVCSNLVSISP